MDVATLGLQVDATGAIRSARQFDGELDKLAKTSGTTTKAIASLAARLTAVVSIGATLARVSSATAEQQRASAQLEATLQSTGGVVGRTAQQLEAYAGALQRVSTFGDEAIIGAQSLLLTFKSIQGVQFEQATQSVLDLATAMGGDLRGAALQIGKALEDPARGLTALTRSGVSFTAQQKETITALVEMGRTAEAQTMILAELNTQFGGSAIAARQTFGGALQALKNAFGDLFEVSKEGTAGIVRFLDTMTALVTVLGRSGDAIRQFAGGVAVATAAWVLYVKQAQIAAGVTAIVAGAQSVASFISLAKAIGLAAAAMQLLGSVGPAKLITIGVSVVAAGAAFLGLKKIIGDTGDELQSLRDDLDKAAAGIGATGTGGSGIELPDVPSTARADAENRVRLAQQELDLLRLTADAAAVQAIRNKAVNDTIKAKAELTGADLQVTLQAIAAEQRLGIEAEKARQARAASQDTQDRIRSAQQALALIGQEGEAAALLVVEQRAVNAEIAARRALSGENLDIALRGILIEKQLATAAAEVTAQIARRKALEDQSNRVQGLQAETTALREQVAAIQQGERALRAVQTTQRVNVAIQQAEADARRANIKLATGTREAIEQEVREQERLKTVLEALVSLKGQNPFEIPDPSTAGQFADGLAQALSAAQGIAVAFGEVP
jgi:hypothetical protein